MPLLDLVQQNRALGKQLVEIHGDMVIVLAVAISLHIGAAFCRHFVMKYNMLIRIWPQFGKNNRLKAGLRFVYYNGVVRIIWNLIHVGGFMSVNAIPGVPVYQSLQQTQSAQNTQKQQPVQAPAQQTAGTDSDGDNDGSGVNILA